MLNAQAVEKWQSADGWNHEKKVAYAEFLGICLSIRWRS
jgi:hypothetical protein